MQILNVFQHQLHDKFESSTYHKQSCVRLTGVKCSPMSVCKSLFYSFINKENDLKKKILKKKMFNIFSHGLSNLYKPDTLINGPSNV